MKNFILQDNPRFSRFSISFTFEGHFSYIKWLFHMEITQNVTIFRVSGNSLIPFGVGIVAQPVKSPFETIMSHMEVLA